MNREDIIRLAQEAGGGPTPPDFLIPVFKRFADLVASAEREACIVDIQWHIPRAGRHMPEYQMAMRMIERIRARGNVATNDTSQERVDKTSESVHEPVAWISATELLVMRGNALGGAKDWRVNLGLEPEEGDVGLYTTPPQRTWVGLTDEEIQECFKITPDQRLPWHIYQRIEAKLKEKNT